MGIKGKAVGIAPIASVTNIAISESRAVPRLIAASIRQIKVYPLCSGGTACRDDRAFGFGLRRGSDQFAAQLERTKRVVWDDADFRRADPKNRDMSSVPDRHRSRAAYRRQRTCAAAGSSGLQAGPAVIIRSVPAVTDVCRPQPAQSKATRCRFRGQPLQVPQDGHTKPPGQRRSAIYRAQAS